MREQILIKVTHEEKEKIRQRMEEMGVKNRSAFLRKMAIDGYCVKLDLSDVNEMVRLLRYAGNNLNQYAKKANETGCRSGSKSCGKWRRRSLQGLPISNKH